MVIGAMLAALAALHPLHTTMTELTVDPAHHTVRAIVRAFADDLGGKAEALVADRVRIEASGRRLAVRGCGIRKTGDLLWMCLEATYTGNERDLRVANALLCDLFPDQVNIVQVTRAGSAGRRSLLFTRGDGSKPIFG